MTTGPSRNSPAGGQDGGSRPVFEARQFYKNVLARKEAAWPKDADGNWIEPLNPKLGGGQGYRDYYDENNG